MKADKSHHLRKGDDDEDTRDNLGGFIALRPVLLAAAVLRNNSRSHRCHAIFRVQSTENSVTYNLKVKMV